ncbi:hypothetical protein [Helicobacter ganmani]|uniref:hypothetical protein n=1 Tax=Helicobacter ganmani TaxID=60246 RepID=UPI003A8A08F7
MPKLTSLDMQIPNRISVSFDDRTEKFVIEKRADGSLKVEHNRKVLKKVHSIQEILNCIAELLGNKPPEKPDLRRNDNVRVPLDNGFFERSFVNADPILTYEGKWVVPCFLYDKGMLYVETDKIQLVRRIGR